MTGLQRGEQVNFSRLTESEVMKIVEMDKTGMKRYKIATLFGVGGSTVSAICTGHTWSWLTKINRVRRNPKT